MKIKEGFILREVACSYLVVAVGKAVKEFNGVVNLNETGAFLWKLLEKSVTEEEMVNALLEEYDVDRATAEADVKSFVDKLLEAKLAD